jgi:RNA polymerase sigma factor (sigma-70 family)
MSNDTELLRRFVEERAEGPFTELVQEHLNLVYSAALREMNGDGAMAEDVSQAVFTELAREAPRLLGHPSLAGWLYTTVRHLAANWRRADRHRQRREGEAHSMNQLLSEDTPNEVWQQVRPVLDDALHELNAADREAVVLRFLEDRPLREVGARLGLNENAARMRVDRALDKLRGQLARRGITSTASGLTAAMAIGVLTPAPAALAGTIASTALASGAVAGSTTLTLMKLMSMTTVKVGLIGALVLGGIAVPTWQQIRLQRVQAENANWRAKAAELRAQETELAALRGKVEGVRKAEDDPAALEQLRRWKARTQPELLRLRGMAGVARRANIEAEQLRAQLARQAGRGGTNPVSGTMAEGLKRAYEQQAKGRLSRLTASLHLTPDQVQAAREILLRKADAQADGQTAMRRQISAGKFDQEALEKLEKEAGDPETQIQALLTPDQTAAYPGYKRDEASFNARTAANLDMAQLRDTTLGLTSDQEDRAFAALYQVSFDRLTGTTQPYVKGDVETLLWYMEQQASALEPVLTPTQLESYRQAQASQAKAFGDLLSKLAGSGGSK